MGYGLIRASTLFPAQAGVIPIDDIAKALYIPVPRASGGDPVPPVGVVATTVCSPRKRG